MGKAIVMMRKSGGRCLEMMTVTAQIFTSFTKTTAVVTLACFLYTSVFSQGLYAIAQKSDEKQKTGTILEENVVPCSVGSITDAACFGTDRVVVNIQDLHCHAEVQRNIARILETLDERYGLDKVYIEGNSGRIDTSWVERIEDRAARKDAVETLVDAGRLTGTEYFSIQNGRNNILYGLEDETLYNENIRRLGKILEQKESIQGILPAMKKDLESLRGRYFSQKNRRLDKLVSRSRTAGIPTEKYFRELLKLAEKATVDKTEYPQMVRFLEVTECQRSLDYRKISSELQECIVGLKAKVPYVTYAALMEKADDARERDEMYSLLFRITREYRVNVAGLYPHLAAFFMFVEKNGNMNAVDLIREERDLIRLLHARQSGAGGEEEVTFINDYFSYLEDYLDNRITADDYAYCMKNRQKFDLLWTKYTGRRNPLESYYGLLDKFYEVNVERNSIFVRNALGVRDVDLPERRMIADTDRAARAVADLKKAKEVVVVVTGGFHSGGVAALLKSLGITYVVITPNVTKKSGYAADVYDRLAKEQAKIAYQTIALRAYSRQLQFETEKRAGDIGGTGLAEDDAAYETITKDVVAAKIELAFQQFKEKPRRQVLEEIVREVKLPGVSVTPDERRTTSKELYYVYAFNGKINRYRFDIIVDADTGEVRLGERTEKETLKEDKNSGGKKKDQLSKRGTVFSLFSVLFGMIAFFAQPVAAAGAGSPAIAASGAILLPLTAGAIIISAVYRQRSSIKNTLEQVLFSSALPATLFVLSAYFMTGTAHAQPVEASDLLPIAVDIGKTIAKGIAGLVGIGLVGLAVVNICSYYRLKEKFQSDSASERMDALKIARGMGKGAHRGDIKLLLEYCRRTLRGEQAGPYERFQAAMGLSDQGNQNDADRSLLYDYYLTLLQSDMEMKYKIEAADRLIDINDESSFTTLKDFIVQWLQSKQDFPQYTSEVRLVRWLVEQHDPRAASPLNTYLLNTPYEKIREKTDELLRELDNSPEAGYQRYVQLLRSDSLPIQRLALKGIGGLKEGRRTVVYDIDNLMERGFATQSSDDRKIIWEMLERLSVSDEEIWWYENVLEITGDIKWYEERLKDEHKYDAGERARLSRNMEELKVRLEKMNVKATLFEKKKIRTVLPADVPLGNETWQSRIVTLRNRVKQRRTGDPEAVDELIAMTMNRDNHMRIRQAAMNALVKIGDNRATQAVGPFIALLREVISDVSQDSIGEIDRKLSALRANPGQVNEVHGILLDQMPGSVKNFGNLEQLEEALSELGATRERSIDIILAWADEKVKEYSAQLAVTEKTVMEVIPTKTHEEYVLRRHPDADFYESGDTGVISVPETIIDEVERIRVENPTYRDIKKAHDQLIELMAKLRREKEELLTTGDRQDGNSLNPVSLLAPVLALFIAVRFFSEHAAAAAFIAAVPTATGIVPPAVLFAFPLILGGVLPAFAYVQRKDMNRTFGWLKSKTNVVGATDRKIARVLGKIGRNLKNVSKTSEIVSDLQAEIQEIKSGGGANLIGILMGEAGDVVNERDVPVARTDLAIVHKYGLRHRTSNAFVMTPDGKLLLQQRVHNKPEPMTLSIFGGHVNAGESYEKAIKRELREELHLGKPGKNYRLKGKLTRIGLQGQYVNDDPVNNEFRSLYMYVLARSEYEEILKRKKKIEEEKAGKTREEFKTWTLQQQEGRSGYGEVWDYVVVSVEDIVGKTSIDIPDVFSGTSVPVRFSADLLQPIIDGTVPIRPGTPVMDVMAKVQNKAKEVRASKNKSYSPVLNILFAAGIVFSLLSGAANAQTMIGMDNPVAVSALHSINAALLGFIETYPGLSFFTANLVALVSTRLLITLTKNEAGLYADYEERTTMMDTEIRNIHFRRGLVSFVYAVFFYGYGYLFQSSDVLAGGDWSAPLAESVLFMLGGFMLLVNVGYAFSMLFAVPVAIIEGFIAAIIMGKHYVKDHLINAHITDLEKKGKLIGIVIVSGVILSSGVAALSGFNPALILFFLPLVSGVVFTDRDKEGHERDISSQVLGILDRSWLAPKERTDLGSDMEIIRRFIDKDVAGWKHYEQNPHKEFREEEQAILRAQRQVEADISMAEKKLEGTQEIGEIDEAVNSLENSWKELEEILAARKKFLQLGVPAYHSHTSLEDDGKLSPARMVDHAIDNGSTVLYVTGHDRMTGSLEAMDYARTVNAIIDMRPGVELDAAFLDAGGIAHVVVTVPADPVVVEKMNAYSTAMFSAVQANLQWRFETVLSLGEEKQFDNAWKNIQDAPSRAAALPAIANMLKKEGLIVNENNLDELKGVFKTWFRELNDYVNKNPEMKEREFFNKRDVIGGWFALVQWHDNKASIRRKAMRSFIDLLYSDADVEKLSGAALPRVEDVAKAVTEMGGRVTLAHPGSELFIAKEIPEKDHDRFWDKIQKLVEAGYLHAIGNGWEKDVRPKVVERVKTIRAALGKTEETLPIVNNIPDYHGKDMTESITRGRQLHDETGNYWTWTWEHTKPDFVNYFRDGRYLAARYYENVQERLMAKPLNYDFGLLHAAYETDKYDKRIVDLAAHYYRTVAQAKLAGNGNAEVSRDTGATDLPSHLDAAAGRIRLRPDWEEVKKLPVFSRLNKQNYTHTELVVQAVQALVNRDYRSLFSMTGQGKSDTARFEDFEKSMKNLRALIFDSIGKNDDIDGYTLLSLLPQLHDIGKLDAVTGEELHNHWNRSANLLKDQVLDRLDLKLTPEETRLLELLVRNHNYMGDIWLGANKWNAAPLLMDAFGILKTVQESVQSEDRERYRFIIGALAANLMGDLSSLKEMKNIPVDEFIADINDMTALADDPSRFAVYEDKIKRKLRSKGATSPEEDMALLRALARGLGAADVEAPVMTVKVQVERILTAGTSEEIARAREQFAGSDPEMLDRYALAETFDRLNERFLLNFLSDVDANRDTVSAGYLILAGNADPETFDAAFKLYKEGKVRKIVIAGGVGRLTIDLVRLSVDRGIIKELPGRRFNGLSGKQLLPELEQLNREVTADISTALANDTIRKELGIEDLSEADLIKKIMLAGKDIDPAAADRDIILERKSTNTVENFRNALKIIRRRPDGNGPLDIVVFQKPLQQLRTMGVFNRVTHENSAYQKYRGISYTIPLQTDAMDRQTLRKDIAKEMWRILIRSAMDDLLPSYRGKTGLRSIPAEYWAALLSLIDGLPPAEKDDLLEGLWRLASGDNPDLADRSFLADRTYVKLGGQNADINRLIGLVYDRKEPLASPADMIFPVAEKVNDLTFRGLPGIIRGERIWKKVLHTFFPEDHRSLIGRLFPGLLGENLVISSSVYSREVLELAQARARAGLTVFVTMPLPKNGAVDREDLINLSKKSSLAELNGALGTVYGKKMGTNLAVLYYEPAEVTRVPVDSRWFGLAAIKLLADDPRLLDYFGIKSETFSVGILEADSVLAHTDTAAGQLKGDRLFKETVFVLNRMLEKNAAAKRLMDTSVVDEVSMVKSGDGEASANRFDAVFREEEDAFAQLKLMESLRNRKKRTGIMKGDPSYAAVYDLGRESNSLENLVSDEVLKNMDEFGVNTVLLRGVSPELNKRLSSVAKKVHDKDKLLITEYVLGEGEMEPLFSSMNTIFERIQMGSDGVLIDASRYRGNDYDLQSNIIKLKNRLNKEDSVTVAVIMPGIYGMTSRMLSAGIKPVERLRPGDVPGSIRSDTWVLVSLGNEEGGYDNYAANDTEFKKDFEKIMKNANVKMAGFDYEFLRAGKSKLAPLSDFTEYVGRILAERLQFREREPRFRNEQGYAAAMDLKEEELPENKLEVLYEFLREMDRASFTGRSTEAEFLSESYRSLLNQQFLKALDRLLSEDILSATSRDWIADILQKAENKHFAGTDVPEYMHQQLAATEIAGYVEGMIARVVEKEYVSSSEPISNKGKRMFVRTLIWAHLRIEPGFLKNTRDMSFDERRQYYGELIEKVAKKTYPSKVEEIQSLLDEITELDLRVVRNEPLGDAAKKSEGLANALYEVVRQNRNPLAIVETLKVLDLFDRDVRTLDGIRRKFLEALPAATKAMQSAA